ncbi:MAG: CHAT domain-containing protein [Bacteroidetes bacterium]|nr:CHAT domain-containing protein [Bacteroidota bacterium]
MNSALSPSGLLHKISFAAIAKEKDVYLCDIYELQTQSGTIKLAYPDNFQLANNFSALVFGGINYNADNIDQEIWQYLEGTKLEATTISEILQGNNINVNLFTGDNSKEEKIKELGGKTDIIHIATHGFFFPDPQEQLEAFHSEIKENIIFRGSNLSGARGFGVWQYLKNQNPLMRSGLTFSGANRVWAEPFAGTDNDGVLTAQEVVNIDLRNTGLVVLSACETGLGEIRGSEGVYGLQRAFKMAGVNYIIMSLWQVPDKETEEFMISFYSELIKSNDIKKSFNLTQKKMRAKYDPYFWAAFVLLE